MKNRRAPARARGGKLPNSDSVRSDAIGNITTPTLTQDVLKVLDRISPSKAVDPNLNIWGTNPFDTKEELIRWLDTELILLVFSSPSITLDKAIDFMMPIMGRKGLSANPYQTTHVVRKRLWALYNRRIILVVSENPRTYAPNPTMIRKLQECASA